MTAINKIPQLRVLGNLFARFIPVLNWLPAYRQVWLAGDITAGITTAIMLVPQAIAYAMLAGLPPETGLYASIILRKTDQDQGVRL